MRASMGLSKLSSFSFVQQDSECKNRQPQCKVSQQSPFAHLSIVICEIFFFAHSKLMWCDVMIFVMLWEGRRKPRNKIFLFIFNPWISTCGVMICEPHTNQAWSTMVYFFVLPLLWPQQKPFLGIGNVKRLRFSSSSSSLSCYNLRKLGWLEVREEALEWSGLFSIAIW